MPVSSQRALDCAVLAAAAITYPIKNPWRLSAEDFVAAEIPQAIADRSCAGSGTSRTRRSGRRVPALLGYGLSLRDAVLFSFSVLRHFPQADSRPSAVLVDELDSFLFESSSRDIQGRAPRCIHTSLQLSHGHNTDTRPFGQILSTPVKEPSGRSALRCGDHQRLMPRNSDSINSVEKRLT